MFGQMKKGGKTYKEFFFLHPAPCCFLSCFQADLGPDKYLSDKDFQCLIKLLPSCSVSTSPSVILVLMTDPQCFLMGDHGQKSWKQSTGSEERRGREDFRSGWSCSGLLSSMRSHSEAFMTPAQHMYMWSFKCSLCFKQIAAEEVSCFVHISGIERFVSLLRTWN